MVTWTKFSIFSEILIYTEFDLIGNVDMTAENKYQVNGVT
jgi:hypothetical protein